MAAALAIIIFAVTFGVMVSGLMNKTVSALMGAVLMMVLQVVHEDAAYAAIDMKVILLLMGLMIICHYLAQSGFFAYVAIRMAQIAHGRPLPLMVLLCLVTAILSALVDNVTTVVLIAPVTFLIADRLEVTAVPYLILEVLAANIGGTATLIGDPPNILVASASGLSFNAFLFNLGPVAFLCLVALMAMAIWAIREERHVSTDVRARVMEMNAKAAITDGPLLCRSAIVATGVFVGFLFHGFLHIQPATVALAGAVILLILLRADPHEALQAVEWPTLFFFVGFFIMVAGLVAVGVPEALAQFTLSVSGGSLPVTVIMVLWLTALATALLGSIPVTTALIPVVDTLAPQLAAAGGPASPVLWWALALGACLGGNATLLGSAANIVVVDIAGRNNREISFLEFSRYGLPMTAISLIIASVYVLLRYPL
jgi:Na+/H+ antiporter NhaD/arsenite permease-like protein